VEGWHPKDWFPGKGKPADREAAREAVANTARALRSPDMVYSGDLPLGETWALTFGHSRDSDHLEESNWDTITKDLEEKFPDDTEVVTFRHWGVGWIEELAVRMFDGQDRVTRAGLAALEWAKKLEDYPVADDEDFSRREYEETLDNIRFEGGLSEEEAEKVHRWLWDNNQRALDPHSGGAAYPSKEDIQEALEDLGLAETEEELEPLPEPPYQDPNQAWIWPEARP